VQEFAVELLEYFDNRKAGKIENDRVKASLVASGMWSAREVFPDLFSEDEETAGGGEVDYDYGAVTWESPETTGIEEYERLQQAMREAGVSLSEDDGVDTPTQFFEAEESAEWL
jgi:hypothetical protein